MIDGVPTWSGGPPVTPKSGAMPAVGGGTPKSGAAKPAPKNDDDNFESLLKDLSESDFDIKLPDDDDEPPAKKK
jgi:hypothetical protein